jgi:hypothetical protein
MRRLILLILTLVLAVGCAGPTDPPPSSIQPIDKAVVAAAQVQLKQDPILAGCVLKAEAQNDLLVLTGEVPTEEAKKKAEELVRKVHGVEKVANHLKVNNTLEASPTP